MICENEKCKKFVAVPLELYTGEWACPYCKAKVSISKIEVKITKENDDAFRLAELCFTRMLKAVDKLREPLRKATVEHCREAASLGNPKAIIRMGYLYELGYITSATGERDRAHRAGEYYRLVWSENNISFTEDAAGLSGEYDIRKLKSIAATRHLQMLKRYGDQSVNSPINFDNVFGDISALGLDVHVSAGAVTTKSENRVVHIASILETCYNKDRSKGRSPLFGLIPITGEEFSELVGRSVNGNQFGKFGDDREIALFSINETRYKVIKKQSDCDDILHSVPFRFKPNDVYYLYFFNEYGHGLQRGNCAQIGRTLRVNQFSAVREIIDAVRRKGQADYVFTEDDVLLYRDWWESYGKGARDLIDAIKKG